MFKKLLILFLLFPLSGHAQTAINDMPAGVYTIDKTHASVTWKVSHLGLSNYTARFTDFDAQLTLDPANLTNSTLRATVNPASVETDYRSEKNDFNKKLSDGKTWFNSSQFPEITFTSTTLVKTGEATGTLSGDLTFLGVTKPLTFDVTLNGATSKHPFANVPALGFSAKAVMKRSEWGFETYVPSIGDDVELIIESEFVQK